MKSDIELDFIQAGDAVVIFGTATGGQRFQVGTIFKPTEKNPRLELKGPIGLAAVAKLIAAFTGTVLLEPGMVREIMDALKPFADVYLDQDPNNPPGNHFRKARKAWEALMRIDCGASCGHFGIPEADCAVHDWRER